MNDSCDVDNDNSPSGFIGYVSMENGSRMVVRVFLNCKDSTHFESSVDAVFENNKSVRFKGLNELPAVRKFNRLIGALEERARGENVPRDRVFRSAADLLHFLSRIKNSKDFGI